MKGDSFTLAAVLTDLEREPEAREHADAVEFRMDMAADPLDQLNGYEGDLPLIITNRNESDGTVEEDEKRLEAIKTASEHPSVVAVDLELETLTDAPSLGSHVRERGADVICSFHDFEGTPSRERLRELISRTTSLGDVGKVATTANEPSDGLRLLSALDEAASEGKRVSGQAMGDAGRPTRVTAPHYGSVIGYAPLNASELSSAPGQYDLATLRTLIDGCLNDGRENRVHRRPVGR